MKIAAIVPARSGSKRFKNKNLYLLKKKNLFLHSIYFAKKLKFISEIIFSSDSKKYHDIARKVPNITIHLRSKKASSNKAMEEDILEDIRENFIINKKKIPDAILWLRPTHPLRCLKTFKKAYQLFKRKKNTVMIVHKEEPRLFYSKNKKLLIPINKKMKNISMIRGQDCKPLYSIFSGEFFNFPKKYNRNFLGNKKYFIEAPKYTKHDIDNKDDLDLINNLIKKDKKLFSKYIHSK